MAIWLVVVLVVVLIVGPAMYVLPSPRERQITRLRQRGMGQGVLVKLTRLPHPSPAPEDRVSAGGTVRDPVLETVAWRMPVRRRIDEASAPACTLVRVAPGAQTLLEPVDGLPAGWHWGETQRAPGPAVMAALPALLAQLPDSTHAVEMMPDGVAVLWREKGDDSTADAVVAVLLAMERLV